MAMAEIIRQIEKEVLQRREEEQRLKDEIAEAASWEFAEQAADELDPRKHRYGFQAYLTLLGSLKTLLCAGMPESMALESVQCGYDTGTILEIWKSSGGMQDCTKGN